MRFVVALPAALGIVVGSAAVPAPVAAADISYRVAAAQQPSGRLDVNVDVDEGGGSFASPVWIAIGVIGVVPVIVPIVLAMRGRRTTVIEE